MIWNGSGLKLIRGTPEIRQRAIGSSMPRRSRKYCRCFSASGLYGGGSVRGAGRPSSISDCRAAATSASPAIRRNAPVAIQIPERSGFPLADRGAGFAFVGLCALGVPVRHAAAIAIAIHAAWCFFTSPSPTVRPCQRAGLMSAWIRQRTSPRARRRGWALHAHANPAP